MALPPPAQQQEHADPLEKELTLDGQEDPHNWSDRKRWLTVALVSLVGFISPLGSSITVAGSKSLEQTLNLDNRLLATLPVSFYVLGLAFGPFAFAPASELSGRRPVYLSTAFAFVALNAGTALSPNYPALIVLRFFAGVAGSTGPTLGSGVIGDMFLPRFRGRAIAVYGLGPLLGPVVGNLISGYIVQATNSFRWLLWTLTIISGAIAVALVFCLEETYSPVLLARKRRRLAHPETAGWCAETRTQAWSFVRPWAWHQSQEAKQKFRLAMTRPFRLLFGNPICAIFSLYQGFVYGVMFIFLTQHPLLFQRRDQLEESGSGSSEGKDNLAYLFPRQTHTHMENGTSTTNTAHKKLGDSHSDPNLSHLHSYGWSIGNAGLSYLGLGIGFLIAMSLNALINDWLYRRLVATKGRVSWRLLNPRVKGQQLAQETEARTMAHQVVRGTPSDSTTSTGDDRTPSPDVLPGRDLNKVPPSGQPPAYSRDGQDSIRPVSSREDHPGVQAASVKDDGTLMQPSADDKDGGDVEEKPRSGMEGQDASTVPEPCPPPPPAAPAQAPRKGQPEYRLPMCLVGMLVLPSGLLLFGWSASADTHWSIPLLGSLVTGAGLILCFQTILMYLVDAFIPYSASATACSVLTRSVLAACFPLFAEYLYAALGYGGGSTLLAGVALLGVPVPILMFFYGQHLRTRFAFHG